MNISKTLDLVSKKVSKYKLPLAEAVKSRTNNPFMILVSTILSARTKDETTARVCERLFSKNWRKLSLKEIEELIKPVNFYKNKSKYLKQLASLKKVPDTIEELIKLPGVGRKTANIVLNIAFGKPSIAVDTHVFRVSARIGLTTNSKTPFDTEMQLIKHIPEEKIPTAHHWLILHGRYVCLARKPKCDECGITEFCKFYGKRNKGQVT